MNIIHCQITLIAKIPIAKCPIAKVPIAKCPIAKIPIAKCPIAKCPIAKIHQGLKMVISTVTIISTGLTPFDTSTYNSDILTST